MAPLRLTAWHVIVDALLVRHFGLGLEDTDLAEPGGYPSQQSLSGYS